jgi:hypothetical protein
MARPLRSKTRWKSLDIAFHVILFRSCSEAGFTGLTPFWWTFLMSRVQPVENVHDDRAHETLIYTGVQVPDR